MEQPTPDPALVRARAAARLRAHGTLSGAEARAVRAARAELGASLRRARRALPPPTPITAPVTVRQPRRRRSRAAAAGLVVLALAALAVLPSQHPATDAAAGEPAAEFAPAAVRSIREAALSRGRSLELPPPLAVAVATPEPVVTPPPAPAVPAAAPVAARTAAPAGQGGPGGNGRGTSPAPSATAAPTVRPTPAPTPSPAPTLAPRPANVTRFTGRVVDARTGRAVSGACVIVGVRACGDRDTYTDAAGRFTLDLPVGSSWDVNFGRSGYATAYRRLTSSAARTIDIGTVRVTPAP